MRRSDIREAREAAEFIETCVFDLSDPQASCKRKRRAKVALCYWATELERMVNEGRAHPYNRPVKVAH